MPDENVKIAFIGNRESVSGFRSFGFSSFSPKKGEEQDLLKKLFNENWSVIFITEDIYSKCHDIITSKKNESEPVVTVIPSTAGSQNIGITELKKAAIDAISTDIV